MHRRSPVRPAALSALLLLCALSAAACGETHTTTNTNNSNTAVVTNTNSNTNANGNANTNANANSAGQPSAMATSKPKLNLNTATEQEFLAAVPNLGNRMAHEFEEYRPYRSIQQFRREMAKYVDAAKIAEYERYVFVPINVNESDAATLQQIPGLDAGEADALIKGRPYADNEAFLAKLRASVSEEDLGLAKNYLSDK
ncbi:MAG TPA: hypothetical protein VER08_06520 [Pyrinomonadaceae bacterium]|nr:hypothetical protein [Pyrinomonadaceae bacterium]